MRIVLTLLLALIALGTARPACAAPGCHAPAGALAMRHHPGAAHGMPAHDDEAAIANCIGCATGLPDAIDVPAAPLPVAAPRLHAAPVSVLRGLMPAATAPPPRILA